jgi:hypothetical protein
MKSSDMQTPQGAAQINALKPDQKQLPMEFHATHGQTAKGGS